MENFPHFPKYRNQSSFNYIGIINKFAFPINADTFSKFLNFLTIAIKLIFLIASFQLLRSLIKPFSCSSSFALRSCFKFFISSFYQLFQEAIISNYESLIRSLLIIDLQINCFFHERAIFLFFLIF